MKAGNDDIINSIEDVETNNIVIDNNNVNEIKKERKKREKKEKIINDEQAEELNILTDLKKDIDDNDVSKKSKYKQKKEKSGVSKQFISKFPILILNLLFARLRWKELEKDEEELLTEATSGLLNIIPDKYLKALEKISPVGWFAYVCYSIISKRQKEALAKEKEEKNNNENIDKKYEAI